LRNRHKEGVYLSKNINLNWFKVFANFVVGRSSFYAYASGVVEINLFLLMLFVQVPIPITAKGGEQHGRWNKSYRGLKSHLKF
jgi:hypothetical protein